MDKGKIIKIINNYEGIIKEQVKEYDLSRFEDSLDIYSLEKSYSLEEFMECSLRDYLNVLKYCLDNNIKGIVDIGCAYGFQYDLFREFGIDYIGIDGCKNFVIKDEFHGLDVDNSPYKVDEWDYVIGRYPDVELPKGIEDYLAVGIMSITWMERDLDELDRLLNKLKEDFSTAIIYANKEKLRKSKVRFKDVKEIKDGLILVDLRG